MMNNKTEFSTEVELYAAENGCSYATAVLEVAGAKEIDEESIPKFISVSLKEKLYIEGVNARTIKDNAEAKPADISEWF